MKKILSLSFASFALASSLSNAAAADVTVMLVERLEKSTITDLGAKGDSIGDILTFANEVFDKDNLKKLGSIDGWCVRIEVGKIWGCTLTQVLSDGQITSAGHIRDPGITELAVIGGTGAYLGARGSLAVHCRSDKCDLAYKFKVER